MSCGWDSVPAVRQQLKTNADMADETTISEAPATESGADDNAGVLSVEDLAASFVERVESEDGGEPTEAEVSEGETDPLEADAAEDEEDVLSQTIADEDEEVEEEESAEAESPAVCRLLKQVGKLTARAKGAEEANEAMKAEIADLKTQSATKGEAPSAPILDDVESIADLDKLRVEALAAKKWALSHLGKDYVEDADGREYDGDQIREIFAAAEEHLTEKIPARGQFLQSRTQWRADARATFPWLETEDGAMYDLYLTIRHNDQYESILDQLPNGDFVGACLTKGIKQTQEEQAAQGKTKKKTARGKPPPSQEGDAAPPAKSKKARSRARKTKALGSGVISEGQLAAYLTE